MHKDLSHLHHIKHNMEQRFGETIAVFQEDLFEKAVAEAEAGMPHTALETIQLGISLDTIKSSADICYMYGFMAQLAIGLGKLKLATRAYEVGIRLLDAEDHEGKELFARLKSLLDSEGWKGDLQA